MPSKSFRQIVSALSLAEGCAVLVREHYSARARNKTVMTLCGRVCQACEAAHKHWPERMNMSDVKKLSEMMAEAEKEAFAGLGEKEDMTTYSSLVIGLLSDVLEHVKDPVRRGMIESVHGSVMRLHLYFDRDLRSWRQYELATRALRVWQNRMAA